MEQTLSYPYLGFGLGLRAPHYEEILSTRPKDIDWLEIISENFIEAHGGYWDYLKDLRAHYPIVMHGVSLSIGSTDPINTVYIEKLKRLAAHIDAPWLSDHVCWTGVHGKNTHDLLPVPYTEESLKHMVSRVRQVQDMLERRILLENPSSYLEFKGSTLSEWEFLARLAEESDCGLLLDVNNIYVSAFNHGYDAHRYIDALPKDRIGQIHLAGHHHFGTHIIDTHDSQVLDEVWKLYEYTIDTKGAVSTMVEWDERIPPLGELLAELSKARQLAAEKEAA